ncbi:MAG TPA: CHASE domain-containing protein [Pyrinomonadaceae bacterium]|nr:CHASE domain-containing protein [Pyrinomonadaceae bacterium]
MDSKRFPRRSLLTPLVVLAVGLLFTFIVSYRLASVTEAEDRARFQGRVQDVQSRIENSLESYTALLRSGAGLFSASEMVTEKEFRTFVSSLGLTEHYPGVQGMGFSMRIKPEEKARILETRKREGAESFRYWPETEVDELHAIIYLEPQDHRNRAGLGFNMFTEPTRRAPMERARDTGLPAASSKVTLFQRIDPKAAQPGFVIYAPVYRKGQPTSNETERRSALVGFVYSAFRAEDFFRGIASVSSQEKLGFNIYDGEELTPEHLLHSSPGNASSNDVPRFAGSTQMLVGGRRWTIAYFSRPGFDLAYSRSWVPYTLVAGILISFLFFWVTRSDERAREKAQKSEAETRESEAKLRQTLIERERAEQAMREGDERYRELVENANDIVFTLDLEGNVTSINKAVESLTGFTQAELLDMNMSDFLTPLSTAAARQMTARKLAGEERTSYEVEVLTKDGRSVTLEISSRLSRSNGKPVGIQGVARDITTRRLAEEALRQADQRALLEYEKLLDRVTGLAQTLGTSRDLAAILRGLREFTLLSVPCNGFFVSLYDPVRDVRTACYGWADGEEIDVSELPPMPVTASGPNSLAVRTNEVIITHDYMAKTVGHPAILVGPDNGLRPQSSLSAPMSVMGRILGTIEVQTYAESAYREEHVAAMRMAANLAAVAIENVGLLERESTARTNAEESNRLKDEFLATVSHELRTPLTAILGWSRMLETESLDSEMASRAIETIKRNAKAQAQIVDDILDVSRIITGNLYLDLHPIEIESVLEASVNVVRPTADAKGIQIELSFDEEPVAVSGDANRLQQVFWNVLSNAVKFTPSGGKVSIQLRKAQSHVAIDIIDTGSGISSEFLPYVFDRFRQADSTSTRRQGGLGLGLAIARHLIEIHGGTIQVSSDGQDKGAKFTLKLPLVGSGLVPIGYESKTRLSANETRGPIPMEALLDVRVLIVDDDEDTLELLGAALKQRSAKVTAVTSVQDALAALKANRPDVLISDIAMPGEDGYQLIEKVIAMNFEPVIPAIAITAYARDEDRERALAAGYHRYLSKPVELREFISTVAEAAGLVTTP